MDQSDPSNDKPVPKRKGKMAKHRDAEKFRFSKNKVFDTEIVSKHSGLRTLPTAITTMFSDLSYSPAIRPTVSTYIFLSILPRLLTLVCGYLRESCKVMISNDEIMSFTHVTLLQLRARAYKARLNSPYPPELSLESQVTKTIKVMCESIFPVSHFIQCIGKVKFENQLNVPILDINEQSIVECFTGLGFPVTQRSDLIVPLGEGNPVFGSAVWLEFIDQNAILEARNRGILDANNSPTTQFLTNPALFSFVGLARITPPRSFLPTVDQSVSRYNSFLSKVMRRVPQCIERIDYESEGHPAILSKYKDQGNGLVEVWADRFLPDDALVLGAVLKFGDDQDGPDERTCVLTNVETTGTLERYARLVQERAQAT